MDKFFKFLTILAVINWVGILLLFKREIPDWIKKMTEDKARLLEDLPDPYTPGY